MSVLIKGMEMPTDCAMMLKIFPDGRVGVPVHLNWCGTMVVNDAEAISVPPHGRLIDADALVSKIQKALDAQGDSWIKSPVRMAERAMRVADFRQIKNAPTIIPAEGGDAVRAIDTIPAADVRPVVKAIWVEEEKDGEWHEYCSNCREHIPKGKWGQPWHSSYCPHCGAEMER